ncbi:basic amino acid ABC transporter substrate-binding protein [Ammoniphilus resinae]|uniref:Polar amino acid transport system substrate-binding protein n=1 Tax=Ammoniphilus resinae TaxID=861532 RepID=A0ABS4GQL8_9BACL|nr:basic amino acid ABC transporter substrate-binding protein [Ammoniphilus resinae]MBP1932563.1 polar amino acid transport system substrate-binding protein [Ammoniphilus resinae]
MNIKKLFMTGVIALSVSALVGCGAAKDEAQQPGASDEKAGAAEQTVTYKVGTEAGFPPFMWMEGTQVVGFEADLLKAIAEGGGFQVDLQNTGWDPLFNGIDTGKIDLGIAAITITEKRKETYDFSEPYFDAKQLILVPKDSTVSKLDDLEGKKVGVQSATTGEAVVQDKFGKTYEGIKGYDDIPAAVDDLLSGRLDAVVADNAVVKKYLEKIGDQGFKQIDDPSFELEQYGLIVKKGNQEVLDKVNAGIKAIKENGKYQEIYNQYFSE